MVRQAGVITAFVCIVHQINAPRVRRYAAVLDDVQECEHISDPLVGHRRVQIMSAVSRVARSLLLSYTSQLTSKIVEGDRIRGAVSLRHRDVVGRQNGRSCLSAHWSLKMAKQRMEHRRYPGDFVRRELTPHRS